MGQERAGRDDTLVRVGIAVIELDLPLIGQEETADHARGQEGLAGIVDGGCHGLARELDVRQILGREELADIRVLVLLRRPVLEVAREIGDGLLLREDA